MFFSGVNIFICFMLFVFEWFVIVARRLGEFQKPPTKPAALIAANGLMKSLIDELIIYYFSIGDVWFLGRESIGHYLFKRRFTARCPKFLLHATSSATMKRFHVASVPRFFSYDSR